MQNQNSKIRYSVRFTNEEDFLLQSKANSVNKSKNFLLRSLIHDTLDKSISRLEEIKKLEIEYRNLAFQLKKIGYNLNQLNINYYQNQSTDISTLQKEMENLWQFIRQSKESLNTHLD